MSKNKDLNGGLFVNDKQGNASRPDYTGSMSIGGKEVKIAGWRKQGTNGKKDWISLRFTLVELVAGNEEPQTAKVYGPGFPT